MTTREEAPAAIRLKFRLADNRGGVWGDDPTGEDDSVVLRSTEQSADGRWRIDEPATRSLSISERRRLRLKEGDVLVTKSSGSESHIGKATLVDKRVAALSPAYSNFMQRLRPGPALDSRFLWYLLQSDWSRQQLALSSTTTTGLGNLTGSQLGEIWVPDVSPREQRAIADFLDRETAQADAFIAKSEELITLLTERRAAEIDQAIGWGRGANSNRSWLGDVPAGWTLAPLRRWMKFITSGSRGWGQYYNDLGGDVFLRIGDLQRDRLELRDVPRQRVEVPDGEEGKRAVTRVGDLLVSITADLGSVAVIANQDAGAFVSQHVAIVRLDQQRLLPRFAAYVVASSAGKNHFEQAAYGGTKIQLSLPDVKDMPIAVPGIVEQEQIADYLDRVTARVDLSLAAARRAIDLARERRAALISAAVTGKIDVGVAA